MSQPPVRLDELIGGTLTELGVTKERARDWLVSKLARLAETKPRSD